MSYSEDLEIFIKSLIHQPPFTAVIPVGVQITIDHVSKIKF